MYKDTITKEIMQKCIDQGMTQTEMAVRLDTSFETIHRLLKQYDLKPAYNHDTGKYDEEKMKRVDFMQFSPGDQMSISGIEKGIFTCYEIKSCKKDVYSGNGLNFLGEKNYIVTTMECYKDILPDLRGKKFNEHLETCFPESSHYFGIMVALPKWREITDEFENPTQLDGATQNWKLMITLPCRLGPRRRSMTELLFCMLRTGK